MSQHRIAVIAGDGIGPEVTGEALKVLDAAGEVFGFETSRTEMPYGTEHYLATKEILPDAAFEELKGHDAIFLGAIGDPRVPVGESEQMVRAIREHGGTVWYLLGRDEGHGFARKTNADYMFAALVRFLETHLQP